MTTTESIIIDGYDLLAENDRLDFPDTVVCGQALNRGTAEVSPEGTPHDRAADLKAQAGGPNANPGEMAFTHTLAIDVLESIPEYVTEFKQVFGTDKIDIDQVTVAIAEFEKTLVTPNSRFDQWLLGNQDAITADELAGYKLFKDSGCVACHNGEAVGGNSFQKMGVVKPYKAKSPAEGLSAVTGGVRRCGASLRK